MDADAARELERLFHDARAADSRRAPPFARVMARRSARRRRPLWPALAGSVAIVAIVAVLRLTSTPAPYELRPGDLRVPTDFLSDLVTMPRAGEIPRVGVVDWFPLESSMTNRREQ